MKSIELKELRSEVLGELEVIQKTAEAEENRDLTEEENTSVDALLAKADNYASKIERAEKIFTKYLKKGWIAFAVTPEEKRIHVYAFDPTVEKIILAPVVEGG